MTALTAAVNSSGAVTPLVYIIAALLTGGLLNIGWQVYRRWRYGPIEDKQIIEGTVAKEIEGLKGLLDEYRTETEVTKRLLEGYREQLNGMTQDLAKAQVRIGLLEDNLRDAKGRRSEIERELEVLKAERERMVADRAVLVEETGRLRERITQLEALSGVAERLTHAETAEPRN